MSVDVKAFDMRTADDLSGLEAALAAAGADGIRRLALLMRVAGEYTDGSREKARGDRRIARPRKPLGQNAIRHGHWR
jgi:hypothetical protein